MVRTRLLPWLGLVTLLAAPAARGQGADGHYSERRSSHFVLLQDVNIDRTTGTGGTRQFERGVLKLLEEAHSDLDRGLELRPPRPVRVVVHDAALFDSIFAGRFRFPTAGFYGESIQVRGNVELTLPFERTLRHEFVHATFHALAPSYVMPAWINEGVAEWFEQWSTGKRHLGGAERSILRTALRAEVLPSLAALSAPSFGSLDAARARLAYLTSYATIEHLVHRKGESGLASFLAKLLRSRDPERALARTYGLDLHELEASLRTELR